MQRDLLLCWHECTWPPTQKLIWQLAWWHYICSLICQQMEKEDCNFSALEGKCRSESDIQQNVRPWRLSMPSAKCLKKMEWTIMALQPRKETCCCVGMNAHGLQLRSLAGSLPGCTTLIVVYLPADGERRLQLPCTWMEMPEWEQHSTECQTLKA